MSKRFYRIPEQGQVTGLAAGIAKYYAVDVTLVRAMLVVAVFVTSGWAILAYFLLALITPTKDKLSSDQTVSQRVEKVAKDVSDSVTTDRSRNWLGVGVIVVGVWFLLQMIWPGWLNVRWDVIWPVILILIGLIIVMKGRR